MTDIATGGGGYIGENMNTGGGDFTGRDGGAGNAKATVNVQVGDRPENEMMDILRRMQTSIFGDLEAGIKGIVRELELLRQQVAAIATQVNGVEKKVTVLENKADDRKAYARRERFMMYFITLAVGIILAILGLPFVT